MIVIKHQHNEKIYLMFDTVNEMSDFFNEAYIQECEGQKFTIFEFIESNYIIECY